jgi:acetyltransferase-like isoleucine patch superfamily enzyme/glycosyltransferase involved in cell wall biosynthesis
MDQPPSPAGPTVSVVIIGRNEGERLRRCIESVIAANWQDVPYDIWYVDSKSTDDSVGVATRLGARCLVLDDSSPCAAKARNLGWNAASGEYILFLDGDTQLHAAFVKQALQTLSDPSLCAAWGHRRESDPGQSIYTRVLDLDWVYPPGRTLYFGGDVLVRRQALAQVGGFDPTLKAGEEPEMCARLRARGWLIEHLDVPMTLHDLAVRSLRAYALRCYRGGIAYAEVAYRMKGLGDSLWQRESVRDWSQGLLYALFPFLLLVAILISVPAGLLLLASASCVIGRTAWRCRWKAPGQPWLCLQYAVHSHVQKLPSLAGQMAWRRAHARDRPVGLVEYKDADHGSQRSTGLKSALAAFLRPLAWFARVGWSKLVRVWSFARLQEGARGRTLHPSNVVLGVVELHGTRNISWGRDALVYPGVYLETQGSGVIEIGNGVVLSRGVHIVAFERVVLDDDCMVGEYSSIRDANHKSSETSVRNSGHDSAPIVIERNVWIGRGVTVLKGVHIGRNSIVGANAVVTRSLPENSRAGGVPARIL